MAKNLKNDQNHADLCHKRWLNKRNRIQESPDYQDDWYSQQCGGCIFFIPLMGILSDDYGACSNPLSMFDGMVRFEHDGCDKYTESEEWA